MSRDGNRLWQARAIPELDARLQANVDRGEYDRTTLVRAGLVLALALQQHLSPGVIAALGARDLSVDDAIAVLRQNVLITACTRAIPGADVAAMALLGAPAAAGGPPSKRSKRKDECIPCVGEPDGKGARRDPPCVALMQLAEQHSGGVFCFGPPGVTKAGPGWTEPKSADPTAVFVKGAKRLQRWSKPEEWQALGVFHAHKVRPQTPMSAWEVLSMPNFDSVMERAQKYARQLAPLGGDLLVLPRRLAEYLERRGATMRLHVADDLRGLDPTLIAKLGEWQVVQAGDGEDAFVARPEAEWRLLGDWIAGGGLEWLRARGTSSLSLVELARQGAAWFTQADAWAKSGRPALRVRGAPAPTAEAFAKDDEDGADFLRRKLNGGA